MMLARSRVRDVRQVGDGMTALMYASWSYSTSRTDRVPSSRKAVTCAGTSHVCNWYGVARRVTGGGRPGPLRSRIAPMVVDCGLTLTLFRRRSLNVFNRHVWPPQRAAVGAAAWSSAAAAAATPAASKKRAKIPTRFIKPGGRDRTLRVQHGLPCKGPRGRGGTGKRAGFRSQWGLRSLQVRVLSPALPRKTRPLRGHDGFPRFLLPDGVFGERRLSRRSRR
jgi:hypothetical protein